MIALARPLLAGAVALASTSAAHAASSQAIFLTAPSTVSKMTPVKPSPRPAPAPSAAATRADAPAATPAAAPTPAPAAAPEQKSPAQVIRHLTNNVQGFRLAGEVGASEWPIYLTDGQVRRNLRFQLGYLSAVSVMSEASTLTLTINDEVVGVTPINAVQAVKTVAFDIPPGLLRPGFNAVRISAQQRHRVDCSLDATFELWTQIDPTQTGLLLTEAESAIDNLADLGALAPDEQGALPIRAVLPEKARTSDVERMLRAVQLISIIGRFEQPVVDTGAVAAGAYGVNLVVAPASELPRDAGLEALRNVDQPRVVVLPATAERRAAIVVTGANVAQVDEAMKQFLVATTPRGTPPGLRAVAAFPGYRMDGGQRVRLRDLGLVSEEFSGRLYRAAFNIIMPADFYAADYGRAMVRLAGGYAPGLAGRAQLAMKVNERTAVSLPLLKAAGEAFKDNPLPIPLGFLRPGLNRIEIEAHLPNGDDTACDPLAAIHASSRFLFLDSTEIEMPSIARVARMPDLAVTSTGGFPFVGAARRSRLFLPSFEAKSIGAAATLVAHYAIAGGRPIDFEITTTAPVKGRGPTLAVAPVDALEPGLLQKIDLPLAALRETWKGLGRDMRRAAEDDNLSPTEASARNRLVLQSNFPMSCHPPRPTGGFKAALYRIDRDLAVAGILKPVKDRDADTDAPTGRDLFEDWDARVRGEGRWLGGVSSGFGRARDWLMSKFTDAGSLLHAGFDAPEEGSLVTPQSLLAIGQNIVGESAEDVWTVVTAPSSDALAEAVGCLVDPRVARQISGRVSVLDVSEAKIAVLPVTDSRFIATQPLSIGNARLIAAGWLSLHSLAYVCGALLAAALLAASTRLFVRHVGRKS